MNDEQQPHWACGKIDCDCDEQYEQYKDQEMMAEDDRAREHEMEMEYPYE